MATENWRSFALPNVWRGVTVCKQEEANEKVPILIKITAARRFVSVEPMLEPVDLDYWVFDRPKELRHLMYGPACRNEEQAEYMLNPPMDWVICGAETGPGARPMKPRWVRDLREQCQAARIPYVWLGVTVCNQEEAKEKLPILMKIPAARRFVSVEPMLEPVDLDYWVLDRPKELRHLMYGPACRNEEQADYMLNPAIDWVICGAETGPGARAMKPRWARELREQCQAARVPFFFKRAGNKKPIPDDLMVREFPEGVWAGPGRKAIPVSPGQARG